MHLRQQDVVPTLFEATEEGAQIPAYSIPVWSESTTS